MEHHIQEERSEPTTATTPRNRAADTVKKDNQGEFGEARLPSRRDRNGFEPRILQKGQAQTRFEGFDGKILSLYSRGMSVRDVKAQLQDLYGSLSRTDFQSHRCDGRGTKLWQNRGLDRVYPIVYFDAIVVKVRQDGRVINKRFSLALG
jgi:putative transposase